MTSAVNPSISKLKSKGVAALIFFLASFSMSTRLFFISDTLPFKISGNSE